VGGLIEFINKFIMTTLEILKLAKRKLLEATTDVIPDDILLIFTNQAYMDVYKRIFPMSDITSATLTLTGGTVTLPSAFGTMYGDATDADGNFYPEVPIEDFYREQIERMVTIEGGEIKAYPTTTTGLTVRYWPKPETLTNAVDPSIDEFFHEPIVYGILWRAHEDLQDEELSTFYKQKFEQMIMEKTSVQSNYEENNQRGAVMFNYQKLV
jgi:hypothetical protein